MDKKLQKAKRDYQTSPSRETWCAYLAAQRRAGQPPFTPVGVARAVDGQVYDFEETVDGIKARIVDAFHPEVEMFYANEWGDRESYPIWEIWSGMLTVKWDDLGEGPGLEIVVTNPLREERYAPGPEFYYEDGDVKNDQELRAAVRHVRGWAW